MTTIPRIEAGNVVKATITFVPESGTVALGDVTAKLRKAGGTEVALTGITTTGTNAFRADWASAETDRTGRYTIRWESSAPSPRIVVEDDTTSFNLIASIFAAP